jgi:hypothetical protein
MLDETRTIESDTERARPQRAAQINKRSGSKPRQIKPAAKAEISQPREIILRLIELFKQA